MVFLSTFFFFHKVVLPYLKRLICLLLCTVNYCERNKLFFHLIFSCLQKFHYSDKIFADAMYQDLSWTSYVSSFHLCVLNHVNGFVCLFRFYLYDNLLQYRAHLRIKRCSANEEVWKVSSRFSVLCKYYCKIKIALFFSAIMKYFSCLLVVMLLNLFYFCCTLLLTERNIFYPATKQSVSV